eukprot:Blabericola_migrator_1__660@NODE_1164_length_5232_cov_13_200774_g794_i0_p1_GENE_NODE_1164_length_5232_cov_13_200774_g794_i0NODE_1164_length_5232_cov_13_200774_g794_i0_p1_ORF_typecomplete_len608_score67_68_NODE_1164_length_5232_cov_13_200774_g794_i0251848
MQYNLLSKQSSIVSSKVCAARRNLPAHRKPALSLEKYLPSSHGELIRNEREGSPSLIALEAEWVRTNNKIQRLLSRIFGGTVHQYSEWERSEQWFRSALMNLIDEKRTLLACLLDRQQGSEHPRFGHSVTGIPTSISPSRALREGSSPSRKHDSQSFPLASLLYRSRMLPSKWQLKWPAIPPVLQHQRPEHSADNECLTIRRQQDRTISVQSTPRATELFLLSPDEALSSPFESFSLLTSSVPANASIAETSWPPVPSDNIIDVSSDSSMCSLPSAIPEEVSVASAPPSDLDERLDEAIDTALAEGKRPLNDSLERNNKLFLTPRPSTDVEAAEGPTQETLTELESDTDPLPGVVETVVESSEESSDVTSKSSSAFVSAESPTRAEALEEIMDSPTASSESGAADVSHDEAAESAEPLEATSSEMTPQPTLPQGILSDLSRGSAKVQQILNQSQTTSRQGSPMRHELSTQELYLEPNSQECLFESASDRVIRHTIKPALYELDPPDNPWRALWRPPLVHVVRPSDTPITHPVTVHRLSVRQDVTTPAAKPWHSQPKGIKLPEDHDSIRIPEDRQSQRMITTPPRSALSTFMQNPFDALQNSVERWLK